MSMINKFSYIFTLLIKQIGEFDYTFRYKY